MAKNFPARPPSFCFAPIAAETIDTSFLFLKTKRINLVEKPRGDSAPKAGGGFIGQEAVRLRIPVPPASTGQLARSERPPRCAPVHELPVNPEHTVMFQLTNDIAVIYGNGNHQRSVA